MTAIVVSTGSITTTTNGAQPAGVERPDEEVHHDASLRLLAELRQDGWSIII